MSSSIGTLENAGVLAWSPETDYPQSFAIGCNSTFSDQGYLRMYALDLTNPGDHFQLLHEVSMDEKFKCIAWGRHQNSSVRAGLVAGGMQDGSLMLWEAGALLDPNEEHGDGLVCNMSIYGDNEFNCLEWNGYKRELLATGGSNVYIVNIEKSVEEPDVFIPSNKKETEAEVISCVSWNKTASAPNILGSAAANGVVSVWDLKVKRCTLSFRDKSQEPNRDVKICWNPNIPTQMAVSFDDPKEAGIQIWDLRNAKAPVTIFKDVHKNARIRSMSWSPLEKQLILSVDRNGLLSCQNYTTSDLLLQETLTRDIVEVQWAESLQSVFACTDMDGGVSIHTTDAGMFKKLSTTHAPKWMKSTACVAAFGNEGIGFRESTGEITSVGVSRETEGTIKHELKTLAELLENNDMALFFHHYAKDNPDLWNLVQGNEPSEEQTLMGLGYNPEEITNKTESLTGKSHKRKPAARDNRRNSAGNKLTFEFTDMNEHQAEAFFDQLRNTGDEEEVVQKGAFYSSELDEQETTIVRNENWDAGLEDLIMRNLAIGNYAGAIDCSIKAGRYAHAFLIAYAKKDQPELLTTAAEGIAMLNSDPVAQMLQLAIEEKTEDLVDAHDIHRWKELAAFILSNYPHVKSDLLQRLASRLQRSGMLNEAIAVSLIARDHQNMLPPPHGRSQLQER